MKWFVLILLLGAFMGCSSKQRMTPEEVAQASVDEIYLHLLQEPGSLTTAIEENLRERWSLSHVDLALEVANFSEDERTWKFMLALLKEQTGQNFGGNLVAWREWLWQQDYEPLKEAPSFKAAIYQKIDPRFGEYFEDDRASLIRLDEIVWGGVAQDGIPPLHRPNMISAEDADYLAPGDVVFGIEVNGEVRAYPKRILAWHEMFTDQIGGIDLAGVY